MKFVSRKISMNPAIRISIMMNRMDSFEETMSQEGSSLLSKETLEFTNGQLKVVTEARTNEIRTQRYNLVNFLPRVLFQLARRSGYLFYLAISILNLVPAEPHAFGKGLFQIPLLVSVLLFLGKELILELSRRSFDERINGQTASICVNDNEDQLVRYDQIKVGDILYLRRGDTVPADILLLDSLEIKEREAIANVQTHSFDGRINTTKKKAPFITQLLSRTQQKNNWHHYRKIISGKLTIEAPNPRPKQFYGYLKLTKDPKVEPLNFSHLIPRGSVIKTSGWVFGMVVYAGMSTKIMLNTGYQSPKHSSVESLTELLMMLSYLAWTLLLLVPSLGFNFIIPSGLPTLLNSWSVFKLNILIFATAVPMAAYALLDLYDIITSARIKRRLGGDLEVLNSRPISDLGCVNYALLDKTGTLTTGNFRIEEIITDTSRYSLNIDSLHNLLGQGTETLEQMAESTGRPLLAERKKGFKSSKALRLTARVAVQEDDIYPQILSQFEIDDGLGFHANALLNQEESKERKGVARRALESLRLNEKHFVTNLSQGQSEIGRILTAFILCHEAIIGYDSKRESFTSHSAAKEEEELHSFSKLCGWSIQRTDAKEKILVKINNQSTLFHLDGINSFSYGRRRMSIVYRENPVDTEATIICKAHPRKMFHLMNLSQEDHDRFEDILNDCEKRGLKPIMFAKRKLSKTETENYHKNYWRLKLSLISKQADFDSLAESIENNLELICIVALKDELQEGALELLTHLRQSGIKTWLVSGDSKESTINVGKSLSESPKQKLHAIHGDSLEQVRTRIYSVLTELQMQLSPEKLVLQKKAKAVETLKISAEERMMSLDCAVLVSGPALSFIKKDQNLVKHFVFMTTFCENVLAYSLTPENKAFLVQLVRTHYPGNPSVLAIGDSWNDALMLEEASISIEIAHPEQYPSCPNAADLRLTSLSAATRLLRELHTAPLTTCLKGLNYLFYKAWLLAFTLFFCNCLQLFISTNVIGSAFVFGDEVFISLGNALILSYLDPDLEQQIRLYPGLYSEGKLRKRRFVLNCLKLTFLEAFVHAAALFFNLYFYLMRDINLNYNVSSSLYLGLYFSVALSSALLTGLSAQGNRILIAGTSLVWTVLVILCTILLDLRLGFNQYHLSDSAINFFKNNSAIIGVLTNILLCLLFSVIFRLLTQQDELVDWVQQFAAARAMVNSEVLRLVEKKKKLIELVKHIFTKSVDIEGSVVEMCSYSGPASFNINEMRLNEMLEIVDENIESKFLFLKKESTLMRLVLTLGLASLWIVAMAVTEAVLTADPLVRQMSIAFACLMVVLFALTCFIERPMSQMWLVIAVLLVFKIAYEWVNMGEQYLPLLTLLIHCYLNVNYRPRLSLMILTMAISTASTLVWQSLMYFRRVSSTAQLATYYYSMYATVIVNIFLVLNSGLLFYYGYEQVRNERVDFLTQLKIDKESQHTQEILGILVPKFVQRLMQKRLFSMQKPEHKVSILFCYVCNFDTIIKEEGKNVVALLDGLFRQYDQLCPGFGVQKIETVGMTYMAATGLKACEAQMDQYVLLKDQTERLLNMAIEMIAKTKGIMYGKNKDRELEIKVGIHLGKVIAGVIGHHKPQFSLIGDTVNTTSRHCSKANPKEIVISEQAFLKVKHKLPFYATDKVKMKGLNNNEPVSVFRIAPDPPPIIRIVEKFKKGVDTLIHQERDSSDRKRMVINLEEILTNIKNQLKIQTAEEAELVVSQPKQEEQDESPEILESPEEETRLKASTWLLLLEGDQVYLKFRSWLQGRYLARDRLFCCVLLSIYLLHSIVFLLYDRFFLIDYDYQFKLGVSITRGVICALVLCSVFLLDSCYHDGMKRLLLLAVSVVLLASCFLPLRLFSSRGVLSQVMQVVVIMEACLYLNILKSLHLFVFAESLAMGVLGVVIPWFATNFELNLLVNYFLCMGIALHCIVFSYVNYSYEIDHFNYMVKNEIKKEQEKGIVSQLLPTHAFLKLKSEKIQNKHELTDEFENVTILFADIQGFTAYSNRHNENPEKVVEMLRRLFTEFDKYCLKFKVYKLYTIGDCYVVMGFTNAYYRNPLQEALNVINMGSAMIDIIKRTRQEMDFPELNMRIGIHTGNIIGGIIGTDIVRYDIYGSDVLIANKFEEHGTPSQIHISDSTKILIDKDKNFPYDCNPNGIVNVEKLGVKIPGYLLVRKH